MRVRAWQMLGDRRSEVRHRFSTAAAVKQRVAEPQVCLRIACDRHARILRSARSSAAPWSSPEVICARRAASSRRSLGSGRAAPRRRRPILRHNREPAGVLAASGSIAVAESSVAPARATMRALHRRDPRCVARARSRAFAGIPHDIESSGSAPRCTSSAASRPAADSSQNRAAARTIRRRGRAQAAARQQIARSGRCHRRRTARTPSRPSTVGATSISATGIDDRLPERKAGAGHHQRDAAASCRRRKYCGRSRRARRTLPRDPMRR